MSARRFGALVDGLPPDARLHFETNRGWTRTDHLLAILARVERPGADRRAAPAPVSRPRNAREAFLRFMGGG